MADTRGVFIFDQVVEQKLEEQWVDSNDVWHSPPTPNTGYYAGGLDNTFHAVATIEKVDLTHDTILPTPSSNLSASRYDFSGTGSINDGYFGGGSGLKSTTDKISYSTDNTVPAPGANLFSEIAGSAASGNQTHGYFGGGFDGLTSAYTSSFSKIRYSDDTRLSTPTTNLRLARFGSAAMGNELSGYFIGGMTSTGSPIVYTEYSTIDKLVYSTDTCFSSPSFTYPQSYRASGAVGNSEFGIVAGGLGGGNAFVYNAVYKLSFSTDTFSGLNEVSALPDSKFGVAPLGNSTDAYFGGGRTASGVTSDFHKIQYSTSTYSPVPNINFVTPRFVGAASGARSNELTSVKLLEDAAVRYIDGVGISSTAQPPVATPSPSSTSISTPNTGYFGGGHTTGPVAFNSMNRIDFTSDTRSNIPSLKDSRREFGATSNSTHGYFGGGWPGERSSVEKRTYSTETAARVPSAEFPTERAGMAATGTLNHGYFVGGYPGTRSSTEKLSYSSEVTAYVPGCQLTDPRYDLAGTGNSTHGYFAGGDTPASPGYKSTMDKVTYSSDTTAAVPGANLSVARYGLAATGNSTNGYFGGGFPFKTNVDVIRYSDDTLVAAPQANIGPSIRNLLTATGNSDAGYFAGGGYPAESSVTKIRYSDNTTLSVPAGTLPSDINLRDEYAGLAATGARDEGRPSQTSIPHVI